MNDPEELEKSGNLPEAMSHWYSIRKEYPADFLIAYRMGDFYEFFYDDAVRVSKLLGLTLTQRGSGATRHPLAGIPHRATQHFKSLVKLGQTLIIVEQLEDPKTVKGRIVRRGVIKILSPGTVVDDNLLDSKKANYICSIYREKGCYGFALAELSSGEFFVSEFLGKDAAQLLDAYLTRYSPVECVLPQDLNADIAFTTEIKDMIKVIVKEHSQFQFLTQNARETLCKHFNIHNLASFGIEDKKYAISAAGGLLSFLLETQKEALSNLTKINCLHNNDYMFLDVNTQRNLELLWNTSDGSEYGTLFSVIDDTQTPMGTRLLKSWLVQPLLDKGQIEQRLDMVQFFFTHGEIRKELRELLNHIGDLSRLITRINYSSTANARDLLNIKSGLQICREIKAILNKCDEPRLKALNTEISDFSEIIGLIDRAIHETPPPTITEGGIIKDGYNAEIDDLRNIINHGKDWVLSFEEKEKKRLGIGAGLKVQFNRVLGYFIQITENAMQDIKLPPEYIQRQTLKGGIRFDTTELKSMETKILSADDNIKDLEYKAFQEVRTQVQKVTLPMQRNAEIIAILDIISNFAEIAQNYNYCRPKLATHQQITIKQGRHPVVERLLKKEPFVPNDTFMNTGSDQILIITGPNWSGKSTYLRQVALIVLLAQIGAFIPASEAEIGIVDRVFTRIGASDDLARGQSTFMMEMNETAQILHYATDRSLVIIDELGRGTGTADGQSISQAVIEYLHDAGIKTLFSTHFHQLINLKMPRIHNYHFKIIETPETRKLIFLRQLVDGGTDKSYGIHVALMAGLPQRAVDRAFFLLEQALCNDKTPAPDPAQKTLILENQKIPTPNKVPTMPETRELPVLKPRKLVQTALFPNPKYDDSELVMLLRSLDLDNMTPLQAFEALKRLKEILKSGGKK